MPSAIDAFGLELRCDAEPVGGAHHGGRPEFQREPHRHRVERLRQRLGQRHRPEILVSVIFRPPVLQLDRPVVANGVGREAVLQRGEVDERLEGRAWLAFRRHRAVELVLDIAAAAHQRPHRAVRRHRHQRALLDAEFLALLGDLLDHRLFGDPLQRRIDGGVDDDVLVDPPDHLVEDVHDPVGDVVRGAAGAGLHDLRRRGHRRLGAVLLDEAGVRHRGEDDLGAPLGAVVIARRRQARGRFDEAGEQRRLGHRHGAGRLAEIALGGGFDAIGAGAEIDPVEIELENLVLGEFVLQPHRQHRLLQLAREGAVLGEEQVLGELLGDRRAALGDAAVEQVRHHRAEQADGIDAVVETKSPVLDGDEGVGQMGRHVLERQRGAAHFAAVREHAGVEAVDLDARRALGDFQGLDRRQVQADPGEHADDGEHRPDRQDRAPIDQAAEAEPAALAASARGLLVRRREARRDGKVDFGFDAQLGGVRLGGSRPDGNRFGGMRFGGLAGAPRIGCGCRGAVLRRQPHVERPRAALQRGLATLARASARFRQFPPRPPPCIGSHATLVGPV